MYLPLSKGFAFCEYVDPELTDVAIQGLNNMELGDRYLVVQRASVGANPNRGSAGPGGGSFNGASGSNSGPLGLPPIPAGGGFDLPATFAVPGSGPGGELSSRAIVMLNMVTAEELIPDEDYTDIIEDIRDECNKYGEVEDLEIPRPTVVKGKAGGKGGEDGKWVPQTGAEMAESREERARKDEERGVGRVYVLFKTLEGARTGVKAIAGRQFGGRVIICAGIEVVSWLVVSVLGFATRLLLTAFPFRPASAFVQEEFQRRKAGEQQQAAVDEDPITLTEDGQ